MDKRRSSAAADASLAQSPVKVEDIDPINVRRSREGTAGSNLHAASNNKRHGDGWEISSSYGHQTATTSRAKTEDAHHKMASHKRSPSPFPDLHPRIAEKREHDAHSERLSAKRARTRRDQSPGLTYAILDSGTSNAIPETLHRQRSLGQGPEEIHQTRNSAASAAVKAVEPGMPIASAEWLLDSAISSCSGMLVMVLGSSALHGGAAWHGGDYEGAQGIVLSVHNTGADNEYFPSTARVKFLKPLHPPVDTFAVPVSLLQPIAPDAAGQQALIVRGEHKGKTAKLWEEVSQGWYVCAAYDYFEVAHEDLVRLLPCAESLS